MSKANNRAAADTFGCRSWRFKKKLLHLPTGLQSAAVGFSYLQIRDAAFSLEADYKSTISSSLPLSLTSSLIYQDFISFHTLLSIRTQRAINNQVNFTT